MDEEYKLVEEKAEGKEPPTPTTAQQVLWTTVRRPCFIVATVVGDVSLDSFKRVDGFK